MVSRTSISMMLMLLVVCGCQTRVTNLVLVPHPATQVAQRGPITGHQTAIAGRMMKVYFSVVLNPDCSVRSVPTVQIIAQPVHGVAQFTDQLDFPHFLSANPLSVCNKSKVAGQILTYTPNADYNGKDFIAFEVITSEGTDLTFNDVITVKSLSPPGDDNKDTM